VTTFKHLIAVEDGPVARVTLNRPKVRNAFNEEVIAELTAWAARVPTCAGIRVAVIAGAGATFCAGADIGWMSRMLHYSNEENVRDAGTAAAMFAALDALPVPLIGRVQGAAIGGGAGLAAVCDIVVAEDQAQFGFTEVRLGILPAVISPFALAKIGRSAARELFLTGTRFDARRALEIGLVHAVVPTTSLDTTVDHYIHEVLLGAPGAIARAKALIPLVASRAPSECADLTARVLAEQRVSPEGQDGMKAFLEKRKPGWHP
jgi:methylglutaconyl-CoA hydratase